MQFHVDFEGIIVKKNVDDVGNNKHNDLENDDDVDDNDEQMMKKG